MAEQKRTPTAYPCQHTIEELREKFDRAVKQAKVGEVLTHEEVKTRHKKISKTSNFTPSNKLNKRNH